MKIIYHCYGGSHSSVIAAALHLGLLPKNRIPTRDELMAIPYYDKTTNTDFGSIRFMGVDEYRNEVYVLGKKGMGDRYSNILMGIADILGCKDQLITVNCMNRVNWAMKIGGFSSRKIGIISLGRPVLVRGSQSAFMELVNLVDITRLKIMNTV
ncbi:MAG: DUF3189 family protein [Syntrophomonadaceae bacterium]|jgi:hypothetical protein